MKNWLIKIQRCLVILETLKMKRSNLLKNISSFYKGHLPIPIDKIGLVGEMLSTGLSEDRITGDHLNEVGEELMFEYNDPRSAFKYFSKSIKESSEPDGFSHLSTLYLSINSYADMLSHYTGFQNKERSRKLSKMGDKIKQSEFLRAIINSYQEYEDYYEDDEDDEDEDYYDEDYYEDEDNGH
ncbi:hypothetical protein ACTA71_000717 [Dictyostelium dimigraforme]